MLDPLAALKACENLIEAEQCLDAPTLAGQVALTALGLNVDQYPRGFLDTLPPEDVALALYDAFMRVCADHDVQPITITNDRWPDLARARWLAQKEGIAVGLKAAGEQMAEWES